MVKGQPSAHESSCRGAVIVYAIVLGRTIQSLTHAARPLCWLGTDSVWLRGPYVLSLLSVLSLLAAGLGM